MKGDLLMGLIPDDFTARGQDGCRNIGLVLQLKHHHVLQISVSVPADEKDVAGKVLDVMALGQQGRGQPGDEPEAEIDVRDPAPGGDLQIHQRAYRTEQQTDEQDRCNDREQADPAGANRGEFLIGTEPAEDQQHRRQHRHGQRKDPHERHQQTDGFNHEAKRGLTIDQPGENFLQHVAEQQYERKDRHGHQQRSDDLASDVAVQRSHSGRAAICNLGARGTMKRCWLGAEPHPLFGAVPPLIIRGAPQASSFDTSFPAPDTRDTRE